LIQDFQETAADPTNGRVPKLGMTILSEEEAYSFYNKYAETIGFSIRRSSGHKMKNSSTMQQRTFTCSRQGIRCIPFFKGQSYFYALRKLLQLIGFRGDDKRENTFNYNRLKHDVGLPAV
jgi:hypothetical protein